jgi:hypothetical protein
MFNPTPFNPTHVLVSRSLKTPIQLIGNANGFFLLTENEWQQGKTAAFELRSQLGIFCYGILVVNYHLEAITSDAADSKSDPAAVQA